MSESTHAEDIQAHVKVYIKVFGALAILTVVTVGVGYLHLPIWPALIVALLIASVKGGLVGGFFMHLSSEKKVIFYVLLVTATFLLAMFVIFISALHDQVGGHLVP